MCKSKCKYPTLDSFQWDTPGCSLELKRALQSCGVTVLSAHGEIAAPHTVTVSVKIHSIFDRITAEKSSVNTNDVLFNNNNKTNKQTKPGMVSDICHNVIITCSVPNKISHTFKYLLTVMN